MTANDDRTRKSYNQMCPLAMALDHVGDRWSMLIVRELLGGPARFGELTEALPGVATNLLADRLRRLEASGIVRRDAHAYALTSLGRGLRAPLEALGAWGMRAGPVAGSDPQTLRSARSAAMGIEAMLHAGDPPPERMRLALHIDDEVLTVDFGGDRAVTVRHGAPETADGVARTTMDAMRDLTIAGPVGVFGGAEPDATRDAFVDCIISGLARMAGG